MDNIVLPLIGGSLIGLSASLLWLFLGRLSGISGMIWQAVSHTKVNLWRHTFLSGLVIGTGLFHLTTEQAYPSVNAHPLLLVVAGLLVGIGVKMGNGCTSGHGVCGVSRGSVRSIVATVTFILSGMITVAMMRALNL